MSDHRAPVAGLDGEREIDLRALWTRLAAHWWLVAGGLVLGAIVGGLLSASGGKTFEAKTLLFLGQPFTPVGGGQIQSLATNPRTVSEIIHSEAALEKAAHASNLSVGQLRGHVTTQTVTAPAQAKNTSPLDEIIVDGPTRLKTQTAAQALGREVIKQVSGYVDTKITLLDSQIAYDEQSLNSSNARIADALRLQQEALKNKSLALADRFLIQANANTSLNFYEARQTNIRNDLTDTQQLLSLAERVERSRIVEPAVAVEVTGRSRNTSLVVGALIGLLLGCAASYLAGSRTSRSNQSSPE
jgi:uncharacterized protein involved in exopolysaccharide biosynthesis